MRLNWYHMLAIVIMTAVASYFVDKTFCGIYVVFALMSAIYWSAKFNKAKEELYRHQNAFRSTTCTSDNVNGGTNDKDN